MEWLQLLIRLLEKKKLKTNKYPKVAPTQHYIYCADQLICDLSLCRGAISLLKTRQTTEYTQCIYYIHVVPSIQLQKKK